MFSEKLKSFLKNCITIYQLRGILWHRGVVVIIAAQLHLIKPELSSAEVQILSAACRRLAMVRVPAGYKAKCLSWVNLTTKTIHHHHH